MSFIDIGNYIYCPAHIINLQGQVWKDDDGVPCRIRVGPRRFLDTRVLPEELKLILWYRKNGKVHYLSNLEVPVQVKEDGSLALDAVALVKSHFGEDFTYCSKDQWCRNKRRFWSDVFLVTDLGIADSHTTWLDIGWTHSTLYFAPGALKLCGHEVHSIYWATFSGTSGATNKEVRPLVEKLLNAPHTLEAEDIREALTKIPDFWFNRLSVSTDRGTYTLDTSLHDGISVKLTDDDSKIEQDKVCRNCSCPEQVDLLLRMMNADGAKKIREVLEKYAQKAGRVSNKK